MRATGPLLLVILIAAAIVLFLQGRSAEEDLRAVQAVATDLRESGVEARRFDRPAAIRAVAALEELIASPTLVEHHIEDLRAIAAAAASWADGAPTPSAELTIAVALRSAADELRSYAVRPGERHLQLARQRLEVARKGLAGEAPTGVGGAPAGIRDRLENLQRSHQERVQDLDHDLHQ